MLFEKGKLKEFLRENKVSSLDDFNSVISQFSKELIEEMLREELHDHLGYGKYEAEHKNTDNSRNGHTPKKVKSRFGEIALEVPRDRQCKFEPIVVKKHQNDISGLDEKIISMYAKGMTTRDIQRHI